jgi:segregation and condensation protein A
VRIRQICEILAQGKEVSFLELLDPQKGRKGVIVSFLAILEMARLALIHLYQGDSLQPIRIHSRLNEMENPLQRIQELIADDGEMGYVHSAVAESASGDEPENASSATK